LRINRRTVGCMIFIMTQPMLRLYNISQIVKALSARLVPHTSS